MLSKDIIKLESTESTNDFAREIIARGIPRVDLTVIVAKNQTRGRGQRGNTWESEPGKNLTFSAVVVPRHLEANRQFFLSMAVSMGVADFIKTKISRVSVKWPNDIYVGDKKVCGILIENDIAGSSIFASIVGIGININQVVFSPSLPNPTSLAIESGSESSLDDALEELVASISRQLERLFAGSYAEMKTAYLDCLYRYNIAALFKDSDGQFPGIIRDVSDLGLLTIEHTSTGVYRKYAFKEVEYII